MRVSVLYSLIAKPNIYKSASMTELATIRTGTRTDTQARHTNDHAKKKNEE